MNPGSSHRPCRLIDGRAAPLASVPAILIPDFPADRLNEVEGLWTPARNRLAEAMESTGLDLESGHWDWRNKAWSVRSNIHRLYAVECENEVQGLMALATRHRTSVLIAGSSVVYVDYVESAPWNLRQVVQPPRFLGIGTVLIGAAIQESLNLGLGGRVGLHALPQAERFYTDRCRMTRYGPDPDYHDLVYFEYPDSVALRWLTDMGLCR